MPFTTGDVGGCACCGGTAACGALDSVCGGAGTGTLPTTLNATDAVQGGGFVATYQTSGDFNGYWVATGISVINGARILIGLHCRPTDFTVILGAETDPGDPSALFFAGVPYEVNIIAIGTAGASCPPAFSLSTGTMTLSGDFVPPAWDTTFPFETSQTWSQ